MNSDQLERNGGAIPEDDTMSSQYTKGIPLENGKHRQGLPGGYPDYIPSPYRQEKEQKAIADYLIKGE